MATAKELITWAASQIGVKESPAGSNKVKYWDIYKQNTGVNLQGNPWCAAFVSCGMWQAKLWPTGKDEGRFRYCPSLVNWAKQNGKWRDRSEIAQPGWIVLFANKGTACHVGFVEKRIDSSKIQTIEGNTSVSSNDNGGSVMRRTRTYGTVGSSWYILGFVAPDFSSSTPSKPSSTAKTVTDALVNEVIDGKWGNDPERSKKLKAAGYDPEAVRKAVTAKLKGSSTSSKPAAIPKPSPVDTGLRTGTYQVTASALFVRTGPSTKYAKKSKSQLTANAKAHANSNGSLKNGTRMSVVEIAKEGSVRVWGKIPSGWVCLKENGKMYAKRV